mgnify:CR=1 FL=1
MRTLLIDNYDSFTFNLYQLLAEVNGEPPIVVRNDAASWEVLRRLPFDNIVISPGPGRPERSEDFGICRDVLLEAAVPILDALTQPAAMGALPTLRALGDPDAQPGDFFGPSGFMQHRGAPVTVGSSRSARDPHSADQLWEASEEATGVRFDWPA